MSQNREGYVRLTAVTLHHTAGVGWVGHQVLVRRDTFRWVDVETGVAGGLVERQRDLAHSWCNSVLVAAPVRGRSGSLVGPHLRRTSRDEFQHITALAGSRCRDN